MTGNPSEALARWWHRLRGHGKPHHVGWNQFCTTFRCRCGAFLWKTHY